jgi:hypothetical protein
MKVKTKAAQYSKKGNSHSSFHIEMVRDQKTYNKLCNKWNMDGNPDVAYVLHTSVTIINT